MKSYFLLLGIVIVFSTSAVAQTDLTVLSDGNPVIPLGGFDTWDHGAVWAPTISVINDTFYLTYQGTRDYNSRTMGVGLATSLDGHNFTKSPSNPILSGDESGFDSYAVGGGPLIYDNGIWYLYYSGLAAPPNIPGNIISRATADNPHGPWTRSNDSLLTVGNNGAWDDKVVHPLQILPTDTGLVMYYMGSDDWYPNAFKTQIGLATSTDGGQTWIKYDDPTTTDPPYSESDPVLKTGPQGSYDDFGIIGAGLIKKGEHHEMFYCGAPTSDDGAAICYATSTDGISWQKYSENPILTFWDDPLAVYGFLESATVAFYDSTYFIYYDYGLGSNAAGIGLAADPPIIINKIEHLSENRNTTFNLFQNYPNPFNPRTIINYELPITNEIDLSIYNPLGQKIATLVSKKMPAGKHSVEWDASGFASGIYYYQLHAGSFIQTKKLILIR